MSGIELGLKGKVAVVTGASRGIGKEIATTLAKGGASIAAIATSAERVQDTAAACRELGVEAEAYGVDVADGSATAALAKEILGRFGQVDVLVNNAGVTRDNLFMRMSEEDFDRVIEVNLKGAFNMVGAFTRPLLKNRGARVINIASVVGMMGNAGQANYAASKGGLIAMTKSLAKEFAGRGVLVNAVAPGYVETDMTAALAEGARDAMLDRVPLARPGAAQDIAGCVAWLASDLSAYVTGQVLVVDGGMTM